MKKILLPLTLSMLSCTIATTWTHNNQTQLANQKQSQTNVKLGDDIVITNETDNSTTKTEVFDDDFVIWLSTNSINTLKQDPSQTAKIVNQLSFTDNTGFISDNPLWRSACQNYFITWVQKSDNLTKLVNVLGSNGVGILAKAMTIITQNEGNNQFTCMFQYHDFVPE